MIGMEKARKNKDTIHEISDISYINAILIGFFQCLALWPGVSRSAATISGGLFAKLDHKTASKFSFIIAVPVMTAAVVFDLVKSAASLTLYDFSLILVGFAISFAIALVSIKVFFQILARSKLTPFAIYRVILAAIVLMVYL